MTRNTRLGSDYDECFTTWPFVIAVVNTAVMECSLQFVDTHAFGLLVVEVVDGGITRRMNLIAPNYPAVS